MTKPAPKPATNPGTTGRLVSKADALKVIREVKLGTEDPLSPEDQFIDDSSKWMQQWLDHADASQIKTSKACLFVFAGDVDAEELIDGLELAPSFRGLFDQDVGGQVHSCSLGLRKVARRKVGFKDASDALKWLSKNVCASAVALVFVPKMRMALVRRASADANDCEKLVFGKVAGTAFDFSQVDDLLERFHEEWTRPHQGRCRVWAKAKERQLNPHPEQQIQGSLRGFFELTVRPKGIVVEEEFFTYLGRGDVRLLRWKQHGTLASEGEVEVCIMELKVLRPDKSPKWNREWALSGIQQALDYRKAEKYSGPSFLCCYDGRKVDADITEVENRAAEVEVASRRYFMTTPGCP